MPTETKSHKQRTAEKIKTGHLLRRLIKHFNGELELSASQITVGLALLKKTLPDLKQTEHTGEVSHKHTQEMTRDELLRIAATGSAGNTKARPGSGEPESVH